MEQNRSKICCLVFLSNTSNYRNKKLFNEKREGGWKEGRGNLIYTHCRLYSCVSLINYDYDLYCKFTHIFIVQWVVKKKKKIQIKSLSYSQIFHHLLGFLGCS